MFLLVFKEPVVTQPKTRRSSLLDFWGAYTDTDVESGLAVLVLPLPIRATVGERTNTSADRRGAVYLPLKNTLFRKIWIHATRQSKSKETAKRRMGKGHQHVCNHYDL